MSSRRSISEEYQEINNDNDNNNNNNNTLTLNMLTMPINISHVKPGNTLCSNENMLFFQDGSTTIEFRIPPKFQPKRIPWRYGLVRDIVWCSKFEIFILLTRDSLYSFNPKSLLTVETAILNKPIADLTINTYKKVKPYDDDHSFWRCACADTTLFINYSGFGTIIDEYLLEGSTCKFIKHWTSPTTCATYEGIWCVRYHPDSNQLGFAIMDARDNRWRIELRSRDKLLPLWQTVLPFAHGDCEISPLSNDSWLAVNSCGIRLVHIAHQKLKSAVEYERELKNAIVLGKSYFVVRTKSTIEIHQIKKSK